MKHWLVRSQLGRWLGRSLLGGLALLGSVLDSGAQQPPASPDFPGSRSLSVEPVETSGPPVPIALPPPPPAARPLAPSLDVHVRQIEVLGNHVLPDAVVAQTVAPYVGRELNDTDLATLKNALETLFLRSGYLKTRIILPDQDFEDGKLKLEIVMGRLQRVNIRGNRGYRAGYLETLLRGDPDKPLNAFDLENRLRALEAQPGIESVRASLRPGIGAGEAVLEVDVSESRRWRAGIDFGNELNPLIGEEAGHVSLSVLNPIGVGDQAGAIFGVSEGLRDLLLRYETPLGHYGTRFATDFRFTDSQIVSEPLSALNIESRYLSVSLDLGQMLYASANSHFLAGVRAEWRQSRSTQDGYPFPFTNAATPDGYVRDAVFRIYQEWMTRTTSQVVALRSTWSVGINALGATSGSVDQAVFTAWLGQAQWRYRFGGSGIELGLRGTVQLAQEPLLPFERFSVGGYYSVRGYRENELVRDNGYSVGGDIMVPILRSPSARDILRVGPFVNFGRAWFHDRQNVPGGQDLASVGANLVWLPWPWFRAEFSYGAQLIDVTTVGEQGIQDHGFSFRIFASSF